jgi:hypothetical protein
MRRTTEKKSLPKISKYYLLLACKQSLKYCENLSSLQWIDIIKIKDKNTLTQIINITINFIVFDLDLHRYSIYDVSEEKALIVNMHLSVCPELKSPCIFNEIVMDYQRIKKDPCDLKHVSIAPGLVLDILRNNYILKE